MGESLKTAKKKEAEQKPTNIFSLAVVAGLLMFLVSDWLPGGLTSTQAFLLGFFAVIVLYVALELLDSRRRGSSESHWIKTHVDDSAGVSITKTESEKGVTIQIYVNKGIR